VRDRVFDIASSDPRVVAGLWLARSHTTNGDRWSDLDLLRRLGLDGWYGRDFDRLPADVLAPVNDALVRSLEPDELDRALRSAVAALLRESAEVGEMADKVEGQLRELASGYNS
jgi:hypothetical protein